MNAKMLLVTGIAAILGVGLVPAAEGAALVRTTVTIKAEGTDLSGLVKSPRPRLCAKNRKVIVIKQIGTRGGGDDVKFASDTASRQSGVYVWSTGNTGTPGKFYARVRRTPYCKGDTSDTIVARR